GRTAVTASVQLVSGDALGAAAPGSLDVWSIGRSAGRSPIGAALADAPGHRLDAVRQHTVAVASAARLQLGARKPLGALFRAHQLFHDGRAVLVAGDRLGATAQRPG